MRLVYRYLPLIMSLFTAFLGLSSSWSSLFSIKSKRNLPLMSLAPSPSIHPFPTRHSAPFRVPNQNPIIGMFRMFIFLRLFCSTPFVLLGVRSEAVKCRAEFACVLIPESGASHLVTDVHDEM